MHHVRIMIYSLNPSIQEITNLKMPENFEDHEILFIGSHRDVSHKYKSSMYLVTELVIREMHQSNNLDFPLNSEHRQCVSTCLSNFHIVCDGFTEYEYNGVTKQINLLGGTIQNKVNSETNLVISQTSLVKSVYDARSNKIPVVSHSWLSETIQNYKAANVSNHILPIFANCLFSSTDLLPDLHSTIRRIVIENGGEWSDNFNAIKTTFLIAEHFATSQKITFAINNSTPIVKPIWLLHHIESSPYNFTLNWWCLNNHFNFNQNNDYNQNNWNVSDANQNRKGIFDGMVFAIERQCKLISPLRDCIEANGGKIGNNPTHIIVTNGFGKSFPNIITITSYWIWYCSENQSIVSPDLFPIFKPLKFKTPLERIHNMIFCLHGIDEKQRWTLSDMIRIVGGSVNNKFNKNMRFLVVNEYNEMFEKMKVTVVSTNFVYKMVNTGELPDPSHYKLKQTSKEESLSLKGDIDFGKHCHDLIMNIKSSENSSIKYVGKQLTDSYLEKLESFSPEFPSSPKPVREFVVTYD